MMPTENEPPFDTHRELERTLTASQAYELRAEEWASGGPIWGLDGAGWEVMVQGCWVISPGAQKDGISERLRKYHEAAKEGMLERWPNWYEDLLSIKDGCRACNETFRYENMAACTHCASTLCYRDRDNGGRAPNGNRKCPYCPMGEMVG